MPENIGNINNLISKKGSAPPPKPPSRIEVLEGRVATLESALQSVVKELTALRETFERQRSPKETATPKATAKQEAKSPSDDPQPPPPKKVSKRRETSAPWDNPEIREELEACRPRVLALLETQLEMTKQGCADALGIAGSLAGRTLSYMMTQTHEITMISPPKTPEDPDPKKIFRLKT